MSQCKTNTRKRNVLIIKDCDDNEFVQKLGQLTGDNTSFCTVLIPGNVSHAVWKQCSNLETKTFPVNRTVGQTFRLAAHLMLWITQKRFISAVIVGGRDGSFNNLLKSFLLLTGIPHIVIERLYGESVVVRSGGSLRIITDQIIILSLPIIFMLVWTIMPVALFLMLSRIKLLQWRAFPTSIEKEGTETRQALSICLISKEYPPYTAGLGAFTYEMAQGLAECGHQVHVLTKGDSEYTVQRENVTVHYYKPVSKLFFTCLQMAGYQEAGSHLENSYWVSRTFRKLNQRYQFDIAEFSETRAEGLFYYLFYRRPPYVVRFHTSEGFCYQLNALRFNVDRFWVRTMEKYWILKANATIGISRDIVRKYRNFYQMDLDNVQSIPNPLGEKWSSYCKVTDSKSPVIVFVGRFELRKGPHILAKAIPYVLRLYPDTEFRFIGGDCGIKRYCEEILEECGSMAQVRFIEKVPREEIHRHYIEATICVFPSLWENFPYTCLEALAMGNVVVATATGGFTDIIEHNRSGVLVDPGDPVQLAESLVRLLQNKELRMSIAEEARRKIKEKCNPVEIAGRTAAVYRSII